MNYDEYTTATLEELKGEGFARGRNIASYQDLPEIGSEIPRHLDWIGIGTVEDIDNACSVFMQLCDMAEGNNRSYTPFEFIASAINKREDHEDAWEAYEEGITDGFVKNWNERKGYYGDGGRTDE